jgi:magnesium transporter
MAEPTLTPELLYLLAGDPAELTEVLSGMRAADIADAMNELPPEGAARVLTVIPYEMAVQVLDAPELDQEAEIFRLLEDRAAATLVEAMSADQQANLFRVLEEDDRGRLLPRLAPATRDSLSRLLSYPEDSAGGIMTTEFVDVPADWTADRVLRHVKEVGRTKETVYAIFVLDAERRLVKVVSLRDVMAAERSLPVVRLGDRRRPLTVPPLADREEVARIISRYNLLAVPVVDAAGHVLGIVTVDDVIDAIVAEQTEDVQKFGGMEALDEPYDEIGFLTMVRKRAGWLTALFLGEMLTATAMGHFEGEIDKAVVLALFIPLIISSGGNSGSQATSLIIRAMALREISLRDWWRVALRELPAGLALGGILGVIGICRILLWQALGWYDYGEHHLLVAATVGMALVGVVTFGSLAGSMLPFVIRRLGFDPASASAPFVATLVDVTGLVIYFSIAFLFLRGTLL